jgi:hypothetical protein
MAKNDLDFKIGGSVDGALEAMQKVIVKQQEQIDKLKEANKEAKKAAKAVEEIKEPWDVVIGRVRDYAAGAITANTAMAAGKAIISALKAEWEDILRKQEAAAKTLQRVTKSEMDVFQGGPGGLAASDETRRALKAVNVQGMTYEEKLSQYDLYADSNRKAKMKEAVRAVEISGGLNGLKSQEEITRIAGLIRHADQSISIEDAFDQATGTYAASGEHIGEVPGGIKNVENLQAMGFSSDQSWGMLQASIDKGQAARGIGSLVSELAGSRDRVKARPGVALTEREKLQNEVAGMSSQQYLDWLTNNPEKAKKLLGSSYGSLAAVLEGNAIKSGIDQIKQFRDDDIFQKEVDAYRKDSEFRAMILPGEVTNQSVEEMQMENKGGALDSNSREERKRFLENMPGISAAKRTLLNTEIEVKGVFQKDLASRQAEAYRELADERESPTRIYKRRGYGAMFGSGSSEFEGKNTLYNPELARRLDRQADLLEDAIKALKESTDAQKKSAEAQNRAAQPQTARPPIDTGGE